MPVLEKVLLAGFGGQGVMFMGKLLAYAAMLDGKEVTWIPSYGPEMRGGTANCAVVISEGEIGSPLVTSPSVLVAMNQPSLEKFARNVAPGGLLLINRSIIDLDDEALARLCPPGVDSVRVPANDLAHEIGDSRIANMVMLGVILAARPVASVDRVFEALEENVPTGKQKIMELNTSAIRRGMAWWEEISAAPKDRVAR